jgi:lysophospholipase L1-like esterase
MVEMLVRAPSGVDSLYRPGQLNLLLYWEGVHDLYEGFTAEETFERIRQYGIDRRRTGFTVVTLSLLPGRETSTPPSYERDRQIVNARMRARWREFADAFVDVGADPELGDPDAPVQGVYFSHDRVHMTDAGSERVAMLVADVLRRILSESGDDAE